MSFKTGIGGACIHTCMHIWNMNAIVVRQEAISDKRTELNTRRAAYACDVLNDEAIQTVIHVIDENYYPFRTSAQ